MIANLNGADLGETDLRNANLSGANLVETYLIGTNLIDTKLNGTNLKETELDKVIINKGFLKKENIKGIEQIRKEYKERLLTKEEQGKYKIPKPENYSILEFIGNSKVFFWEK